MLALEYAAQNLLHAAGYHRYSSHYQSRHVETTARNIVHRTGVEEGKDGGWRCGVNVGLMWSWHLLHNTDVAATAEIALCQLGAGAISVKMAEKKRSVWGLHAPARVHIGEQ